MSDNGLLLEARQVSLSFGGVKAVDQVSLTVRTGDLQAVIGPNGAGKTTLFNALTGYFMPDSGEVLFRGQSITRMPNHQRVRMGISRTFQTPSIFPELTVGENLSIGVTSQAALAQRFGPLSRSQRKAVDDRIDELLTFVNMRKARDRIISLLSHGSQRLVEIAMSLSVAPALIMLDEPTAGLAEAEANRIISVIRDLHARLDLTVLFVEHNMRFVSALAGLVTCMDRGRVIAQGPPSRVLSDPSVREAYLGTEEVAAV
jgi:branched-chain amino acid transport system ATP-binding protein